MDWRYSEKESGFKYTHMHTHVNASLTGHFIKSLKFKKTREINLEFVSLAAPPHRLITIILAEVHLPPHRGDIQQPTLMFSVYTVNMTI